MCAIVRICHGMCNSNESGIENQVKILANTALFSDTSKPIRDTNLMKDCFTQILIDQSENMVIKSKLSNKLGTIKWTHEAGLKTCTGTLDSRQEKMRRILHP